MITNPIRPGFTQYLLLPSQRIKALIFIENFWKRKDFRNVQVKLQGQWTKWCCFFGTNFSWKLILSMPPLLGSSRLRANYDALPSPSNLHRWNITSKTSCKLCHKQIPTLAHVHGTCKFALQEGQGHFLTWLCSADPYFCISVFFSIIQLRGILLSNLSKLGQNHGSQVNKIES